MKASYTTKLYYNQDESHKLTYTFSIYPLVLWIVISMPNVLKKFRTMQTLPSTSSHFTLIIFRYPEIAAGFSTKPGFSSTSTTHAGFSCCSRQKYFTNINQSCMKRKLNTASTLLLSIYKTYTLHNWSVRFSRTGKCSSIQTSARRSGCTHHSFSNNVFNLLNVGHHLKSLLKINWTKCKAVTVKDLWIII